MKLIMKLVHECTTSRKHAWLFNNFTCINVRLTTSGLPLNLGPLNLIISLRTLIPVVS